MAYIVVIFFLRDKNVASHMDHISKNNNSSNDKVHSCDQTRKTIVNLDSKKGEKNNNSSPQLTCLHN